MREGATNKGGGLSRCAKGSQTRAGVIALKKQPDKQINVHLKAQEWGHRKEVGVRAKGERHDEKRAQNERRSVKTNERKASDRKMSVTKPNERESERTKSEREQNENERA